MVTGRIGSAPGAPRGQGERRQGKGTDWRARRAEIIMTDKEIETDDIARPGRREFIVAGAAGAAGLVAAQALPGRVRAAAGSGEPAVYPVVEVERLADLAPGATLDFTYPDDDSPALLIRLTEPAEGAWSRCAAPAWPKPSMRRTGRPRRA